MPLHFTKSEQGSRKINLLRFLGPYIPTLSPHLWFLRLPIRMVQAKSTTDQFWAAGAPFRMPIPARGRTAATLPVPPCSPGAFKSPRPLRLSPCKHRRPARRGLSPSAFYHPACPAQSRRGRANRRPGPRSSRRYRACSESPSSPSPRKPPPPPPPIPRGRSGRSCSPPSGCRRLLHRSTPRPAADHRAAAVPTRIPAPSALPSRDPVSRKRPSPACGAVGEVGRQRARPTAEEAGAAGHSEPRSPPSQAQIQVRLRLGRLRPGLRPQRVNCAPIKRPGSRAQSRHP